MLPWVCITKSNYLLQTDMIRCWNLKNWWQGLQEGVPPQRSRFSFMCSLLKIRGSHFLQQRETTNKFQRKNTENHTEFTWKPSRLEGKTHEEISTIAMIHNVFSIMELERVFIEKCRERDVGMIRIPWFLALYSHWCIVAMRWIYIGGA